MNSWKVLIRILTAGALILSIASVLLSGVVKSAVSLMVWVLKVHPSQVPVSQALHMHTYFWWPLESSAF